MKTMFRTCSWSNNITEFEVTKLTDKSVYYIHNGKPQRELIETQTYKWHNTIQEAVEHKRKQLIEIKQSLQAKLEYAHKSLREFECAHQNNCKD